MSKRSTFSKLGVIAATVGSAVGLGNIWRFPYETGQNGGAAFLLIYIVCVLILGIPVMLSEFLIGRHARSNSGRAFQKLKPNSKWFLVGYLGIFAAFFILGFYTVIAGWTIDYIYQAVTNQISGKDALQLTTAFNEFTASTYTPLIWIGIFLLLNYFIISRGVTNGIEKASNILTPLLFLILIVFCVRSLFFPGAAEGLSFLFHPDFSKINSDVILRAMGQAFFSLSLGMGTLTTYASYFSKETSLPKTAFSVAALDTLVAILAGCIIFPAVFTFGISPEQGPTLVFITLPNIFQQIPGAYIWSILFFTLLGVAALTSTISLFEVVVAFMHEDLKLSRKKATGILVFVIFILSSLSSLSFGPLKDAKIFGFTIFNFCDFTASNILLPLGGMFIAFFTGWILDRKFVEQELTNNGTLKMRGFKAFMFCLKYIAPFAIFLIFLYGLGVF